MEEEEEEEEEEGEEGEEEEEKEEKEITTPMHAVFHSNAAQFTHVPRLLCLTFF